MPQVNYDEWYEKTEIIQGGVVDENLAPKVFKVCGMEIIAYGCRRIEVILLLVQTHFLSWHYY